MGGCVGSGVVVMMIGSCVGSGVVVMICVITIGGDVTTIGCGVPAKTSTVGNGVVVIICVTTTGGDVTTTVTTWGGSEGVSEASTGRGVTDGDAVMTGIGVSVIVGLEPATTSVGGGTPGVKVSPGRVGVSMIVGGSVVASGAMGVP